MKQSAPALPSITVPKSGRALRGLGESVATAAATGGATLAVPLPLTAGRPGLPLDLRLTYDSGSGHGPFGHGWSLSIPSITRKTDKGLPRYSDVDTFMLRGGEELVPSRLPNGDLDSRDQGVYRIQRYRPRIENAFSRIERWIHRDNGDSHWRLTTRENVLSIFGRTENARIADPANATRVFSWLLEETRDDCGNIIRYLYRAEDGARVVPSRPSETSRFDTDGTFRATAQRYLKRVQYGNRAAVLDREAPAPTADDAWLFEAVFDYGEHDPISPQPRDDSAADAPAWSLRPDPLSSYRATFEVRTYRLCRRVLMFHRFVELGEQPTLVRSLELAYDSGAIISYLTSMREVGHVRGEDGTVKRGEWPALEIDYARPRIVDEMRTIDRASLSGMMSGVEPSGAQWLDLDGEGIPGVLIASPDAWYYKAPLGDGRFTPPSLQQSIPVPASLQQGQQLIDLGGDGNLDLVSNGPVLSGYFKRTPERTWRSFASFAQAPNIDWRDEQMRSLDLDGDGFPDLLITQGDALIWYRSRAHGGFDPPIRIAKATDERRGPAVVFTGDRESIQLADMTGDGLVDLVRVRNGEVCYWPNLGFGHFGAKVTCDRSPQFDTPEQFDPSRVRFADIDGSGASDVIYLGRDGVRIYANEAGNSFAAGVVLRAFPSTDRAATFSVVDLLGRGTSCLVRSSPLASDPVTYVDLAAGIRPHVLTRIVNNLGAETRLEYGSSTSFYLEDQRTGRPWITRLPFPVNVVTRVETYDRVSQNRFVSRYAYHHGYFDGVEREFCGFGMVEQWDTEELQTLGAELASNVAAASHVPPVHTKTWYHTGVYIGRDRVSRQLASEYHREPGIDDAAAEVLMLPDSDLPSGLTLEEEREACRALKGSMLRREVYAIDGTARAAHPYVVNEQSYGITRLQRGIGNDAAVFLTHPREVLTYHYERDPLNPRVGHELVLQVDAFGNALKSATFGYGRRLENADLPLDDDRAVQARTLGTYVEQRFTESIDDALDYRAPLPCEMRTFELIGYPSTGPAGRYLAADLVYEDPADPTRLLHRFDAEVGFHEAAAGVRRRRLIEHLRTIYRRDDLDGPLLLGRLGRRGLQWDSFQLAFSPGMIASVFERPGGPIQALIPDPLVTLPSAGYRSAQSLITADAFPAPADNSWWIPSSQIAYSADANDAPSVELAEARAHFFLPRRLRDAFGNDQLISYDSYDLNVVDARDAVGNQVTARIDYRVLAPIEVRDPTGHRTAIAFDARGLIAATAVMGRIGEAVGDSLTGVEIDIDEAELLAHLEEPFNSPASLLGRATTRTLYDLFAYQRTRDLPQPSPTATYTLTRETHNADLPAGIATAIQHNFAYSDGFGRSIQTKHPAERGPLTDNGPVVERWAGSGWTVYNNKGLPVRQYEPFFTATHRFELARAVGVSPVNFYDPLGRVAATLYPDGSYEKVLFDAWREIRWDRNDTSLLDPRTDADIAGLVAAYLDTLPPGAATWYQQRQNVALGTLEQDAAQKAAQHANTPTSHHLDALGRRFLTLDHAGFRADGSAISIANRAELDIDGEPLVLRDAVEQAGDPRGRAVARYLYDLAGNLIFEASIDAGMRWTLDDVLDQPHRSWDDRGHAFRMQRDPLRRPLRSYVQGLDPANPAQEVLVERLVYGEQHPDASRNLRTAVYMHFDQAGVVTDEQHDFKGNSEWDTRRFATQYKQVVDWTVVDAVIPNDPYAPLDLEAIAAIIAGRVEAQTFSSRTRYDAINRPIQIQPPRLDAPDARRHVVQPAYNAANLVERLDVWLDQIAPMTVLDSTVLAPSPVGIANIDYDAHGRRVSIQYKNGVTSSFRFDRLSSRLVGIYSRRGAAFTGDCENPNPPPSTIAAPSAAPAGIPCGIQNLQYIYDAAGNLTHARDLAQHTVYFDNRRVEASSDYTYDPLYRLTATTGREHLGLGGAPSPHGADDGPRARLLHPADGNALGRYSELYGYDAVGNLQWMRHVGQAAEWVRYFDYEETSRLEPNKRGNRLTRSRLGALVEVYSPAQNGYDHHGNLLRMPHLAAMQWNFRNQLSVTQRQVGAGADQTWYVYDAAGVRVRKVTETAAGQIREERIYLGAFERYRRLIGDPLERETLHVLDGSDRLASIETRTRGNETGVPRRVVRYQLDNHLSSACVELDEQSRIIGYEEYAPYGSTTLRIGVAAVPTKRYGFLGNERDDESGLIFFGARYYAPWLGRWTSCDPVPDRDRPSLYVYASANPSTHIDIDGLYDPAAFGRKLEAYVTQGEQALLVEDRNIGTSLVNTGISTLATIARGSLSIFQVGTGAAQGVEDIKRGFSEQGDAYDVAIGVSRILADTGEVASASLGVAGNVTKGARIIQAAKVEQRINTLRRTAARIERRIDTLNQAAQPNAALIRRLTNRRNKVAERVGEVASDKAAARAGLTNLDNPRRIVQGGPNAGRFDRRGIDKVYTGRKPFAKDRAVFVEAKANLSTHPTARASKGVPLSTGRGANPLTQGSGDWIRNRLASSAASGNNVAANLQTGLNANRLRLESFAVVGDSAVGGSSKVFRLTGQSGVPSVSRAFGYGSEVLTINLVLSLDIFARSALE